MTEHASRMWVPLWYFSVDQNHWQELLNAHLASSESLTSVWENQNRWQEWLNLSSGSECLIKTTDENGWTCIQGMSLSKVSKSEPLTRTSEYASRKWVPFQCLERLKPLMRMTEHASSGWVACQCLRRSKPLTRMAEHPVGELLFSVWGDQIYWQERLNMHLESESLSNVSAYLNHLGCLILYSDCNLILLSDSLCNTVNWFHFRQLIWRSF